MIKSNFGWGWQKSSQKPLLAGITHNGDGDKFGSHRDRGKFLFSKWGVG